MDVIVPTLGRGGAQKAAVRIAAALCRSGALVRMLTLSAPTAQRYVTPPPGVAVVDLGVHEKGSLSAGSLPRTLIPLVRELARSRPDAVVAVQDIAAMMTATAMTVARVRGRLVIAERREPSTYRHARARKLVRRTLYRRANLVVAQTRAMRDALARDYAGPIEVIPNPCPSVERPARPDRSCNDRWRMVAAARLEPFKDFPLLVRGAAAALRERPNWSLDIFGSGSDEACLREAIEDESMQHAIALRGHSADLQAEHAGAHLFAHPSINEGFPNTVAEAVGAGLPIVACAAASGVPELVHDGVNGIVLTDEARTPEGFSDALGRLMDDAPLRARMGSASLTLARAFDAADLDRRWVEAVLGVRPPGA